MVSEVRGLIWGPQLLPVKGRGQIASKGTTLVLVSILLMVLKFVIADLMDANLEIWANVILGYILFLTKMAQVLIRNRQDMISKMKEAYTEQENGRSDDLSRGIMRE